MVEDTKVPPAKPVEPTVPSQPAPAAGLSAEEVIAKLEKATGALEEASKKLDADRANLEKARVAAVLAGRGEAGVPAQKLDETPEEYKDRILRGEL